MSENGYTEMTDKNTDINKSAEMEEEKKAFFYDIREHRAGFILDLFLLLALPMVTFLVAEAAMNTGCRPLHLGMYKILLNYLLYGMLEAAAFALTVSVRWALRIGALLGSMFAAVVIYVTEFTSMPLYATDLTNAGTAAGVLGNYKITLNRGVVILLIYLVVVFVLTHFVRDVVFPKKWIARCVFIPIISVMIAMLLYYTVFTDQPRQRGMPLSTYRPIKSYRGNGGLATFVRSFMLIVMKEPEGYSMEVIEKLEETYVSDSVDAEGFNTPNIIVIMNEAYADLQLAGDLETNEPVMPFYDSMKENTIKGISYASVFGGHTAHSEYEFLSGDSAAFLPHGATAYQVYIKDEFNGLTSNLASEGYGGLIAMHPFTPTGYNRNKIYPLMGFETFLSKNDFTDPVLVRKYISDESDYDRIIEEYEKAKKDSSAPFYLFNVTMQNHGGYDEDFDNLPDDIKITTEGIDDPEAERYLNLVHLSDKATEKLITYFDNIDDPTMIVMFGDHQPGLSTGFYDTILGTDTTSVSGEEKMSMYNTPFFIWANFDIEEQEDVRTSMNYLQTLMLDTAGMRMSGYNKFLKDMSQSIPQFAKGGYWGEDGNFYLPDDNESPYYELVQTYEMLCYNHVFDVKNRSRIFDLAE